MPDVYIGIGSNLGDREENCRKAIEHIAGLGIRVQAVSAMYETEPWGVKDQPRFINMAVSVSTDLAPQELLVALRDIEVKMGRTEAIRNSPRIIDLDILLYNDRIVKESRLKIPHPRMHERTFVLDPLAEIAPDVEHPLFRKTVLELKEALAGR